jgi:hypothetical protein
MRGLKNSQSSGIMIGVVGLGLGFGKQYLEGLGGLFGQRSMAEYDKDSSDQHPFGGVIGDSKKLIQSADMLIHPIQTIEKSIDDNGLALGWGVGLGQVAGTALLVSHFAADGIEGYSKIGGEVDGSFAIKSSAARWGSAAFSVGKATLQEAGNMIIPKFGE